MPKPPRKIVCTITGKGVSPQTKITGKGVSPQITGKGPGKPGKKKKDKAVTKDKGKGSIEPQKPL
jgi:hypothetical protein